MLPLAILITVAGYFTVLKKLNVSFFILWSINFRFVHLKAQNKSVRKSVGYYCSGFLGWERGHN
jgi:hypothetical protein